MEEQGAATHEISRNVQQASQGTQQVSTNIADVQRGATETGSASSQVLSAAQSLSVESNRLKVEVSRFLDWSAPPDSRRRNPGWRVVHPGSPSFAEFQRSGYRIDIRANCARAPFSRASRQVSDALSFAVR